VTIKNLPVITDMPQQQIQIMTCHRLQKNTHLTLHNSVLFIYFVHRMFKSTGGWGGGGSGSSMDVMVVMVVVVG